jgi:hypothetical protein
MADLAEPQSSQAGMTDLINATKGSALNTGALVQSSQNLVTSTNNQVTQTTNLVTQATNQVTQTTALVTQTTNLVTQATNQVTQLTALVTAVTNLTTSINNALSLGPWSTWSPTVSSQVGTITTLGTIVARYATAGKNVYFSLTIPITTNGTGANWINATLPLTAKAHTIFAGREGPISGKSCVGDVATGSATPSITFYDGSYPGSNGAVITISGTYEAQ